MLCCMATYYVIVDCVEQKANTSYPGRQGLKGDENTICEVNPSVLGMLSAGFGSLFLRSFCVFLAYDRHVLNERIVRMGPGVMDLIYFASSSSSSSSLLPYWLFPTTF